MMQYFLMTKRPSSVPLSACTSFPYDQAQSHSLRAQEKAFRGLPIAVYEPQPMETPAVLLCHVACFVTVAQPIS